ncbi:MAG TPA: condensation domain-containing protein [Verrucomicrobiae bacterium]|nr:condensation domain-containing protein [Verrucomicrobiae bacterium]
MSPDQRFAGLSAEQRALFELLRRQEAWVSADAPQDVDLGHLPLSFGQERLWLSEQSGPGNVAYNLPFGFRLRGPLDVGALEAALNEVVRRHQALRATFAWDNGEPFQTIAAQLSLRLPIADLLSVAADQREAEALRLAIEEIRVPFDLERGPLVRARLVRLAQDDHILVVTVHHIISDCPSLETLFDELSVFYGDFHAGRTPQLPPNPLRYAEYIQWQRDQMQNGESAEHLDFWEKQLVGAPPALDLPMARPRPPRQTFHGARLEFELPADVSEAVRALTRREGVTLFMTLLAAFQTLLHRYSGQEDIVVGTAAANRYRSDSGRVIGCFANNIPLRTSFAGGPGFIELLRRVRDMAIEAYAHGEMPFQRVVETVQPPRDVSRNPLFQHTFVVHEGAFEDYVALEGLSVSRFPLPRETVTTDLALAVIDGRSYFRATIDFNTDLFDDETIRRMGKHYQNLLEGIVADPSERIGNLPLLTSVGRPQPGSAPRSSASVDTNAVVGPRTGTEQALANIWAGVLKVNRVGVRDNFFELGGHSLLAVRLFAQIKKLTGKDLPLVTLFQAPTVEKLAAILDAESWEAPWASLVPIKPSGSRPPFYCVHGVGGNILEFLDLAKYVDADQPFYGLQAIGLDGKRPVQDLTIEQMAAHYIEEIRAFQPRGPYHLGGSSFGGLVAYEMAQQLLARGEEVGLLALFDTNGPGYPRLLLTTTVWQERWNWWADRVRLHWGNFAACRGRGKLTYLREKAIRWKQQARWKLQARKHRLLLQVDRLFWPEAIRRVHRTGYRATTIYTPRPYPGKATLFRATEQPHGIYEDRTLGWGTLVQGGLEIYDTPGHHGAIVREPRARGLALQLTETLNAARAQRPSAPGQLPQATSPGDL